MRKKECEIEGVCERERYRDKEREGGKMKDSASRAFFSLKWEKSWNRVRRGSRINLSFEGSFGKTGTRDECRKQCAAL